MKNVYRKTILSIFAMLVFSTIGFTQTTEFTYQGSLRDGANPANANYDFEFLLFDSLSGGTQIGLAVPRSNVAVAGGIFAVTLDFGTGFPGANRFLEIRVRNVGGGGFTILAPRQMVGSSPYSVKSLNAETATTANNASQLGGVAANQFVLTTDPRMTDWRNPLPGSANYIWNTSEVPQPSSSFIISGNGTAGGTLSSNIVNASTQYNIGGSRVLSIAGANNIFAGVGAGGANTTGSQNSFFGRDAGQANTTGDNNSFFGRSAGQANTTGGDNSFFGRGAGFSNTTGFDNSFFGRGAGDSNTTGFANSFFGRGAGISNTTGFDNSFFGRGAGNSNTTALDNSFFGTNAGFSNSTGFENSFFGRDAGVSNIQGFHNSFFGKSAGASNTTGGRNAFFGTNAGDTNTTGDQNTFFGSNAGNTNTTGERNTIIGYNADVLGSDLTNATAVGYLAVVGADHSLILGAISGINGCGDFGSFCESVNVGIGTTTPVTRLHVVGGTDAGTTGGGYMVTGDVGAVNLVIDNNEIMARSNGNVSTLFLNADGGDVNLIQNGSGNVGIGIATTPQDRLHVDGIIRVQTLGSAGTTSVCRNASDQLSTCSSSLRYKTNINRFGLGLKLVDQLKPITFDWKDGGLHDLGLGAEDVAAVEPLLVTYNKAGEVEGVKYDRVAVVLLNAVKEQQAQIEAQQELIDGLKKLVCLQNPQAKVCKEEQK